MASLQYQQCCISIELMQEFREKTCQQKHQLYQHRPQIAKTNFCVRSSPSTPTIAHYNGTLHWHPAMAPPPLPQSWPSPSPRHSTLQWHPAMAPSNSTTSTPPKLVITLPPTIAHYNGTQQWHPTIAPSNGTTSTAPCTGTLVPRPIRQSGSSPSPPIGSKNPYSYRYLGKKTSNSLGASLNVFFSNAIKFMVFDWS